MTSKLFSDPVWMRPHPLPRLHAPLDAREAVDVAVIGGGILGLSTALFAARRGLSVRVVEAQALGEGASGLNGGQVIPGLKHDPDWLLSHFGPARGEALIAFASSTADAVFELIDREQLRVPHARAGWIQAAHTDRAMASAESRDRQWQARGADVTLLNAADIALLTGARGYVGGWLDRRAGVIDPLAFTLELARIAEAAGARIAEQTTVAGLRKEAAGFQLTMGSGAVLRAKSVLVATNAYSDALIPGLARTLVPLHSFQIATAPLSAAQLPMILPQGSAVSDSRRILVYYRKTADGRLVLGGRRRMALPRRAEDWGHLQRAMLRLYPALQGVAIDKRWFGRVAVTTDHLPHIHEPEKGLVMLAGCQGRGVAMMTAMGQRFADYLADGDAAHLPLPMTPIRPIPMHAFRQIGVAATIGWYRMLDALER